MVYAAMPQYVQNIVAQTNYKWHDERKTDHEVVGYFDRLILIGQMARNEMNIRKQPPKKKEQYHKPKKEYKECKFCGLRGHVESKCRKKKRAEAAKQPKPADHGAMEAEEELTIDDLTNDPIMQELMNNIDNQKVSDHMVLQQHTQTKIQFSQTIFHPQI